MSKLNPKRSRKAGLPPGTPVYIGDSRSGATKVDIITYGVDQFSRVTHNSADSCPLHLKKGCVTWIDVDAVNDINELEKLSSCLKLHPLVLEDIANTQQRPKLEDYGDYLYIVLKMIYMKGDEVVSEQVSLILGDRYVVSFQEHGREGDVFGPVRTRLEAAKGKIREMGADYLAYCLIDAVVDGYFAVMENLGERIESLEEEVVTSPNRETIQTIHQLKREIIFLRRAVWPLREVVGSCERGESPLISDPMRVYFRDVYDHTVQVMDAVETFRDMISSMLDIYLSSVSNRMNEVMKVLTIIATIFIPLTFMVGVYGMNFKYMPELEWPWSYPILWSVMIGIAVGMLILFRRKKWL